jgi:hypothetical protein
MKVAILIPAINRPCFVERTVTYYDSLSSPHPIYIVDSSDLAGSSQTINELKRFKNAEVKNLSFWRATPADRCRMRPLSWLCSPGPE